MTSNAPAASFSVYYNVNADRGAGITQVFEVLNLVGCDAHLSSTRDSHAALHVPVRSFGADQSQKCQSRPEAALGHGISLSREQVACSEWANALCILASRVSPLVPRSPASVGALALRHVVEELLQKGKELDPGTHKTSVPACCVAGMGPKPSSSSRDIVVDELDLKSGTSPRSRSCSLLELFLSILLENVLQPHMLHSQEWHLAITATVESLRQL